MLSELQTQKITRLFNVMDLDGNGVLEVDDYKIVCQNLGNIRGWNEDSSEYQAIYDAFMLDWENVKNMSSEQNGQVTLEDWLKFHDYALQTKEVYDISVTAIADQILNLFDFNQDGKFQFEEFAAFHKAYQIDESLAKSIFPKLDTAGQGYLTRDEILELIDQFFKSNDPSAKGNQLFGPY